MFIHEVCKKCSLTKKAIYYYEKQGLIRPNIGENGYRNYSDEDVSTLKEIFVLRKLGLTISEINNVLLSSNKAVSLLKYKYLMDLKREKVMEQQKCLELLIENYNVDKGIEYIDIHLNRSFTIKEKLIQAFPGVYGIFLSVHFGPFLNEKADTPEKEEAYGKIVDFLDKVRITREMEEYLESVIPLTDQEVIEKMNMTFLNAVEDIENYIVNNQQEIEEYIKFRNSEDYKSTPAFKLQQLLVEFQQSSGYDEIFVENLKILSPSYLEYSEKLQEANKILLERYPQTAKFY
ncbi:MerR family transcriptional regulator [Caldibacillus thermoamylovorans]|uniref:MerR family transcriptional regulator n=1 Tax=Caldibacillus thermoamylovorans TaxID=35841 RepID=UPI00203FD66E|nr:MerR family transcriptional regulator [Caldibacillus thermoamylovorans]MCM3797353.1 MerR family transcriptional regulator [Caldibacillus thermoamylovorans]